MSRKLVRTRTGRARTRSGVLVLAATAAILCGAAAIASAQDSARSSTTTTTQDTTRSSTTTTTQSSTTTAASTATTSGSGGTSGSKGSDGSIRLKAEKAAPGKAFFYGERPVVYRFTIDGDRARNLKIQAVRRSNWQVVKVWRRDDVTPGTHKVRWNGRNRHGGGAKKGTYLFRVRTKHGREIDRSSAKGDDRSFKLYPEKFPIRARHTYGDGFGAPRSGHTHQGQDVFAKCGKPLVAARGGRVQYRGNDPGGAGYYLVVDGRSDGHDYVYMHVLRRGRAKRGERVHTGEQIARVGQTGNASGCHLHFELWSKPGWYEGGHPMRSVTKQLKKWDRWS